MSDWTLPKRERRRRTEELNARKFPSEVWFAKQLRRFGAKNLPETNPCLLGKYFGDFVWKRERIVVELDGSSHEGKEEYDKKRDLDLTRAGFKVIRIPFPDSFGKSVEFMTEYRAMLMHAPTKRRRGDAKRNQPLAVLSREANKRLLEDLERRREDFQRELNIRKRRGATIIRRNGVIVKRVDR